jgi:3-methyladenine DNA glycosylase AlkC
MAEALKDSFGAELVRTIAASIAAVHPPFPARRFERDTLAGFDALALMPRARHVAAMLHRHLPTDYARSTRILLASLGPPLQATAGHGMSPFVYLPHTLFVARQGLADEHFELSMRALHALTQRFTAEFGIRAFLERHPQRTLAQLHDWASDPSVHVRRLVSEGTRPRLPWAARLPAFQRDPAPVIALLERLKDDPEIYVRRSVANNLNDIGKDHPHLLIDVCRRWLAGASAARRALVAHALRTLVKAGDARALDLLGFGASAHVAPAHVRIDPRRVRIDDADRLRIGFDLVNSGRRRQDVLVDLRIFYVKANGSARPKVFRLGSVTLETGAACPLSKTLSLRPMTTRTHYPGMHRVEVLLNGTPHPLGQFRLLGPARTSAVHA